MSQLSGTRHRCQVCGKDFPRAELFPAALVRDPLAASIRREHPDWNPNGCICLPDLNHYRAQYVRDVMEAERGELSELEQQVLESIRDQELLSRNLNTESVEGITFGQRVADHVAEFGGSWRFILSFMGFLALWILVNSLVMLLRPWDPYPFILLNLILSCLAAVQAPIIMMSQNRQEARDRLRAENDYRINLKAELEIRSLHAKMDLLLSHQWQRLLEIQEIQTEMMEELIAHRSPEAEEAADDAAN